MRRALPDTVFTDAHQPFGYYLMKCPGAVTFAFIRDPWERTHSWWRHQNYCKTETFRDYVMRRALDETYVHGKWNMGWRINDQYQWICHEDRYVDHIGRFENMAQDFSRIVDALDIELTEPLQHRNKSIRRETHSYNPEVWDSEMVAHMDPLFRPFAEEFGYLPPDDWGRSTKLMNEKHLDSQS